MLRGEAFPAYSAPTNSRPPRCRDSMISRACSYTAADHRRQLQKVGVPAEQASVHAEMTTAASKQAKQETTSELASLLSLLTQKFDALGAKMEKLEESLESKFSKQGAKMEKLEESLESKISKQETLLVTKMEKVDSDLQALRKDLLEVNLNTRWGIVLSLVIIMTMCGAADVTKTVLGKLLQF